MSLPYSSTAGQPFGSVTVTINSVTYRALNWNPTKSTRKIRRNDTDGDQAEYMIRKEPSENNVTLQLAATGTAVPGQGVVFTVDSIGYVTMDVTPNKPEGDFWTVDVQFTEVTV